MVVNDIPIWKITVNELLARHIESLTIIRYKINRCNVRLEELIEEMEFSRASATLFINNIFHNSVNYNDHEHIIYVEDESHVSLYPVDILDDGMIPEEFPESIATVSINKRQIERIYTVLGDFMERIEEFQELKATTLKMMEDYDTIRDEIIRIISEPSLRPMFQDGEFFDPDVHTLLVSYHKDGWCLEYIRTEDAVEFFNVKKAEDVSFSVEFNKK